jgi:hypothetical protein
MNNPDHIFESLETIFWLFFDADPGWKIFLSEIRDGKKFGSGILDKHPVSATLVFNS